MFYTYVLLSVKNSTLYVGSSNDLRQRIEDHNKGIGGEYTKKNRPYQLIFYEAFLAKKDAVKQEEFYKSGYGRDVLHEKIKGSLLLVTKGNL